MFTEGIINSHRRLTAALAMRCYLLEHEPKAAASDFVLPQGPRRKATEIRFIGIS